jgi:hypothetical protein
MSAAQYAQLFRVWPMRADKTPLAAGFGAAYPTASYPVDRFDPALPVGILCGPLQPGIADELHIIGLDLDGAMTRATLEQHLGPLPPTLTSKGERHLYYFAPATHGLYQRNKAILVQGGALDIRPCAGGYLVEKGDWDGGYDPTRIVMLPDAALAKLTQAIGEKRKRDGEPTPAGPIQIADSDIRIADLLCELWQHETTGHAAWAGLGGWLNSRGVSRDRAEAVVGRIAEATHSTHNDPLERAGQAYDGAHQLGRPTLEKALAQTADPIAVAITLDEIELLLIDSVPGFVPPVVAPARKAMLNLVSSAELASRSTVVDWLVEGLDFAPGRPMVIGGKAGSGKTRALQDMALRVAGAPGMVWGEYPISRTGSVLHIDVDQGPRSTQIHYLALAYGMGVKFDTLPIDCAFFDFSISSKQGINPAAVAALKEACTGRALCIIDSLRGIAVGLDEQDSTFGEVLMRLTELATDTGCAFAVVAHSGHDGLRARGTSAIQDRGGAIYQLTRDEDAPVVEWRQTKTSEFGRGMRRFSTTLKEDLDGLNDREVITVVPSIAKRREETHTQVEARIRKDIIDFVRDNKTAAMATIVASIRGKTDTVKDMVKALASESVLTFGGGVYSLRQG